MVIVSTKEFESNQSKYFDMAVDSEVCIKDDKYMFHLTGNIIEPDIIYEPDDDFYRSITMDEFIERAVVRLEKIDKIYAQR